MTDASDPTAAAPAPDTAAIAAREWGEIISGIGPIAERVIPLMQDPQDPLLRQEMYRLLFSLLGMSHFAAFLGDARHPDFWPLLNQAFNIYGPNPDMYYFQAPIEGSGIYRISGFRGTSLICDFQVGGGQLYNTGLGPPTHASANYDLDDLKIGQDGWFEVLLSAERPPEHTGNWWRIFPDTTNVHVRQISNDWLNEVDARFVIERLDVGPARPRLDAPTIEQKLKLAPKWAENWAKISLNLIAGDRDAGLVNNLMITDFAAQGGTRAQMYVKGQFDLQPDEALIIETGLPDQVQYWSFVLNDLNYSVMDYTSRQSSLNGHQAHIDSDGKFRAVVSAADPGVPNWLDTCGYQKGAVLGRWRNASSAPVPNARKVMLANVRASLPPDTPYVTPQEREATLRQRSLGARLRRRW